MKISYSLVLKEWECLEKMSKNKFLCLLKPNYNTWAEFKKGALGKYLCISTLTKDDLKHVNSFNIPVSIAFHSISKSKFKTWNTEPFSYYPQDNELLLIWRRQ